MTGLSPTAAPATASEVLVLSTGDVRIPVYQEAGPAAPRRADQPYRPPAGAADLREAVSAYLTADGRAAVAPDEVLIAPGARLAILSVLAALPGDSREVLLPSPYWASYPALIAASGARPVIAQAPGLGASLLETLEAARTPATCAMVINSPRNPDGLVIRAGPLREVTGWARDRGLVLLFDQVYRSVPHPGGRPPSVLDLWDERPEHCVVIDGLSKSHALAGLRLGWAVTSGSLLARAIGHASHVVGGTSSAGQDAARHALSHTGAIRAALTPLLAANLAAALRALTGLPGVTCPPPGGGIFVFADLRGWLARQAPPAARRDLAGWLRAEHGVAVADGAAFGAPGHIRLSFALPAAQLRIGLDRLRRALAAPAEPGGGLPRDGRGTP
jgi:aspartate aminotransferase